ncbi:MAG: aspartyl-phosphate phosphatase Spo0E family protein [Caryophanon sp.]|nr:aspartyl-phosphate phosphatase Spo0E family protein [Caryophanon sp.]
MDNLLTKLEIMRAQMIQSGITYGFLHEKTIQLSKQVDELLNLYYIEQRTRNSITMHEN